MKAEKASYAGIVLLLSVLLSLAACRGITDTVPSAQESGKAAETTACTVPPTTEKEQTAPESSTVEEDEIGTVPHPPETSTTRKEQPSAPKTTTAAEVTTVKETEPVSATILPTPTDTAEIVQFYNDTINRAVDSTAPFTKTRKVENYDSDKILDPFKSKIYNFMGIGQTIKTRVIPKEVDYDHYLQRAYLTVDDVNSAFCTVEADGNYRIELCIKDGNSKASKDGGETCYAPLDKSGIAVGKRDKSYWDHKTAGNIYASMQSIFKSIIVEENYEGAYVNAAVQPDGTPVSVEIVFKVTYNLSAPGSLHGKASMNTYIKFDQFSIPQD